MDEVDRRNLLLAVGAALVAGCATSAPGYVLDQRARFSEPRALPKPSALGTMSVEEALRRRRSRRAYARRAVSLNDIGQLFWAGQGVTAEDGRRTSPSAGARYPVELYGISNTTLMHYVPEGHMMEERTDETSQLALASASFDQGFVSSSPITFVIAGVVGRTEAEYGHVGSGLMLREAGHVAQNMLLQATALGLSAVPVGGFDPVRVARLLALAPGEEALYLLPVGHPV